VSAEPPAPPPGYGAACAAAARAITESLPLDQVLGRLAEAARLVMPFETLGIWHAESPDDPLRGVP